MLATNSIMLDNHDVPEMQTMFNLYKSGGFWS